MFTLYYMPSVYLNIFSAPMHLNGFCCAYCFESSRSHAINWFRIGMSFWVGYNLLKPNLVNNVQVVDSEQTNQPYTPPFNVYHFLHCLFLEKKNQDYRCVKPVSSNYWSSTN